jgi:hypothetical protein
VGLYGGTGAEVCDPEGMAAYLEGHPATAVTWAGVQGIQREDIRSFLGSLTPVVLRADTAVTNHGHRDGRANAFQSVLQSGTAVLVDDRGVPRVRCSCGNPLADPVPRDRAHYEGQTWPELESRPVTVVRPAPTAVEDFVVVRRTPDDTVAVQRPRGSRGDEDAPTDPETVRAALDFSPEATAGQADQDLTAPTSGSEPGTGSSVSATPPPTGSIDGSPTDRTPAPTGSTPERSPSDTGATPAGTPPAGTTPVGTTPVSTTPVSTTPVSATPVSATPDAGTPADGTVPGQGATDQATLPSDGTAADVTLPDESAPPG